MRGSVAKQTLQGLLAANDKASDYRVTPERAAPLKPVLVVNLMPIN